MYKFLVHLFLCIVVLNLFCTECCVGVSPTINICPGFLLTYDTIELTSKAPMRLWTSWYQNAKANPVNDWPETMTLATVKPDGSPVARTVLMRGHSEDGFKMYWDYRSPKTEQIEANNEKAALVFRWSFKKPSGESGSRQVRVEGIMEKLSTNESLAYFNKEPIVAQVRTAICTQSRRILPGRREEMLTQGQALLQKAYCTPDNKIEMPSTWGGYLLKPNMMEFYQGTRDAFNARVRFRKQKSSNEPLPVGVFKGEGDWVFEELEP